MSDHYISAIDVGTSQIRCLVASVSRGDTGVSAEDTNDHTKIGRGIAILGYGSCPSEGVQGGLVLDRSDTAYRLQQALRQACVVSNVEPEQIERFFVAVHQEMSSSGDRPLGLDRTWDVPAWDERAQALTETFSEAGLSEEVVEYVASAEALALSVTTAEEHRRGCVLIDLGAGKTEVAVFLGGGMRACSLFPFGTDDIVEEMSDAYDLTPQQVEEILRRHGNAGSNPGVLAECRVEAGPWGLPDGSTRLLTVRSLAHLINETTSAWFRDSIVPAIRSFLDAGDIRTAIVAGGGSLIPGVTERVGELLGEFMPHLRVRVGRDLPDGMGGFGPAFASNALLTVARGLLLHGGRRIGGTSGCS
jgi:cell division ATPase FtsA